MQAALPTQNRAEAGSRDSLARRFDEAVACSAMVLRDEPGLVPIREMLASCFLALGGDKLPVHGWIVTAQRARGD